MAQNLFLQTVVGIIWDFDKTLIPGYIQEPIFQHYGVAADQFWREISGLEAHYSKQGVRVTKDILYLNHMLTYVQEGKFPGLNNALLRQLGGTLSFHRGLPDFLPVVKAHIEKDPRFKRHDIRVEHYIVSNGLRQMILGSAIAEHVEYVWGCEFIEDVAQPGYLNGGQQVMSLLGKDEVGGGRKKGGKAALAVPKVIRQLGYVIDNTTKTRAIFEINKGSNKDASIDVNASMRHEDRRIPFQNMIYVADGPSDIPVFSLVNRFEGKTFAVYGPGSEEEFAQARHLQDQGRVNSFGAADYQSGSHTFMWLTQTAEDIAQRIVDDRTRALAERVEPPPRHILNDLPKPDRAAATTEGVVGA